MRFGGRAYNLEDISTIGAMGLPFVEINLLEGRDRLYDSDALMREAERWNLTYLVHAPREGNPKDIKRLSEVFYREFIRLLDLCPEIGAPLLTVHFWMDKRFIDKDIFDRKQEILCRMAQEGAQREVQVCLENLSEGLEDLAPVLENCPELGITADIGHGEILSEGNRALDIIQEWPDRIKHVHVHDNRGGNRVKDDLHLPIGEGCIDFPPIFRALINGGYRGTVTIEVPSEHLATSIQRLQSIVAPMMEAMKT